VLSGFLLTTHLLSSLARRTPNEALPRYFFARVKRVFPAFWAQMAILFVVAFAVYHAVPDWYRYLPMHLFMMHNMSEDASTAINRVYWTLPIELGYYVLLPLVALARAERRGGAARWRLLAILYAGALATGITYRHIVYSWYPVSINWISNQLPGCID